MKRFYKDFDQFRVRQIFELLEDAGIPCTIKNEFIQGASGEIPHHEALPEVWLIDAQWETKATKLLREFESDLQSHDAPASDWACRCCHEVNEPQFRICWKCEAPRPI
uniref:putative signal transducing protein n=1 Tax=Ningiella ruwaisensis TaxID=2364274 RepID=UPI00109FD878|nr:DUF2007 domain-containing protein [Ningiella ruwaisensis]